MSESNNGSPTPWEIEMGEDGKWFFNSDGYLVGGTFSKSGHAKQDAFKIVLAVNTHDALLEEVKRYRSLASDTEKFSDARRRDLDDLIERAEGKQ